MWLYINIKRVLSAQSVILSQTCDKGAVLAVCLPNFQKITDISSNPEQKRLTHGIPKKEKDEWCSIKRNQNIAIAEEQSRPKALKQSLKFYIRNLLLKRKILLHYSLQILSLD